MKAAIEIAPYSNQRARPRQRAIAYYKLAGLLLAVAFPTLFWVSTLLLLGKAFGISLSASAVVGFGLAVAVVCLVGASLVSDGLRQDLRSTVEFRDIEKP
jgi:hypothetical protein